MNKVNTVERYSISRKKSRLANLFAIVSVVFSVPMIFAGVQMGIEIIVLPSLAVVFFALAAVQNQSADPVERAYLLSPFLLSGAMALFAYVYKHPFHPTPDYLSTDQREFATQVVHFLFFGCVAWLFTFPWLFPGKKWIAALSALSFLVAHVAVGFLCAMLISGTWI